MHVYNGVTLNMFIAVDTGGVLLEAYLTTSASYTCRRLWTQMQSRWANVDWDVTSQDEFIAFNAAQDDIIARVRNDFYFHLISQLASRGTAANRQLFFISLVMRHKGLSRSGLNMLSMMNLGLSPRSFDPELSDQLDRYRSFRR